MHEGAFTGEEHGPGSFVSEGFRWEKDVAMGRILVVDDEVDACRVLQSYLVTLGHTVDYALSGEEALEKVGQEPPDLVLLDLRMPTMDGMETLKHLKSMRPGIAVIILTAVHQRELGETGMHLGAVDYLTKPVDFAMLESSVTAGLLGR